MSSTRVLTTVALVTALGGALAAPHATAGPVGNTATVCSASKGQGMAFTRNSDDNKPFVCGYVSNGKATTVRLEGLSGWTVEVLRAGKPVPAFTKTGKDLSKGGAPVSVVALAAHKSGDTVRVTVLPSCDATGTRCGTFLTGSASPNR